MKVVKLKKLLKDLPDDMDVVTGWQFYPILVGKVKTVNFNGKPKTAFQLIYDRDDID